MNKKNKLINCKHCNHEISVSAKTCTKCGAKNKKPIYKSPIPIIILFFAFIFFNVLLSDDTTESVSSNSENLDSEIESTSSDANKPIEYTKYDMTELVEDLQNNALSAREKYNGKYVEVNGELNVIDSAGRYISLIKENDLFAMYSILCNVKNEEQKKVISSLSKGQKISVKGKITDVGEIFGYYLDIVEIVK